MFSSQTLWTIYLSAIAVLFTLPTAIAFIKGVKDLPLVIGLNVIGAVVPVPCWIAAMGFAICGAGKRFPRRPAKPAEPSRIMSWSPPGRTNTDRG